MAPVVLLRPYSPSASLRGLARARHVEAVRCLEAGDREGWLSRLRDVDRISEEARRAERWERECRGAGKAAGRILEMAGRSGE
jgi:hypothetical protein